MPCFIHWQVGEIIALITVVKPRSASFPDFNSIYMYLWRVSLIFGEIFQILERNWGKIWRDSENFLSGRRVVKPTLQTGVNAEYSLKYEILGEQATNWYITSLRHK